MAIADAEGLDGLSMRRVATELGAGPMSLYRHVTDKDDLLLRMMDAALREARLPADPPPGWRPRLEVAARSLWAAFRRHPWLAPALSLTRPQAVAGGLAYTEWVLAALTDAGLTTTAAFDVHLTLFTFVRGVAVNLETEAAEAAASGLTSEEWVAAHEHRLRAITLGRRLPALRAPRRAGLRPGPGPAVRARPALPAQRPGRRPLVKQTLTPAFRRSIDDAAQHQEAQVEQRAVTR